MASARTSCNLFAVCRSHNSQVMRRTSLVSHGYDGSHLPCVYVQNVQKGARIHQALAHRSRLFERSRIVRDSFLGVNFLVRSVSFRQFLLEFPVPPLCLPQSSCSSLCRVKYYVDHYIELMADWLCEYVWSPYIKYFWRTKVMLPCASLVAGARVWCGVVARHLIDATKV